MREAERLIVPNAFWIDTPKEHEGEALSIPYPHGVSQYKKAKAASSQPFALIMNQQQLLTKAKQLASAKDDFSIIVGKLEPEYQLRLKWFVRNLPEETQEATIYGRANRLKDKSTSTKTGRFVK